MPNFRTADVTQVLAGREGLQRVELKFENGTPGRAYVLTELIGECAEGDEVIVNTTAVDRNLGTGGWHFVHWNLSRQEFLNPGPEHIMKLRYTSLQCDVGTDELSHPECDRPLDGIPVVVCSVHSQVAVVAAAFAEAAPGRRLGYVMTDGAALPLAFSNLVADLTKSGLLTGTVTAGHAFGGDLEAVTVPSALGLAAHTLESDAIVVGMGPGVVGTGTSLGTTAIEVAPILDAVASAGGKPILCVRASDDDPRPRHRRISHHTATAVNMTRSNPWVAPVPPEAVELPGVRVIELVDLPDPQGLLDRAGLVVTTMGRSVSEDPLFFEAAAAAGAVAARLIGDDPSFPSPASL